MRKQIISATLLVFISFQFINAQHIITALGGQAHTGVYDTKPIRKFNKVIWKYQLEGSGSECCIIDNNTIYVSSTQRGMDNKYFGNIYALSLGEILSGRFEIFIKELGIYIKGFDTFNDQSSSRLIERSFESGTFHARERWL